MVFSNTHHVPAAVVCVGSGAGTLLEPMMHFIVTFRAQQHEIAWVKADARVVDVVRRQLYDVVDLRGSGLSAFIAYEMFLLSDKPCQIVPGF